MAGALAAWNLVPHMGKVRAHVSHLAQRLTKGITQIGLTTTRECSHILPIILQDNAVTLEAKKHLLGAGIKVSSIRPPTVPVGTARLRLGLHVGLTESDIDVTLAALEQYVMPLAREHLND